jgi:hypothetical protein
MSPSTARRAGSTEVTHMKIWIALLTLSAAATLGHAQEAKAPTEQQNRMKTCNAEAKGIKGDERKTFMKSCLSGDQAAAKPVNAQQGKMKSCNADAASKSLKGDERKQFMSSCLKG